MNDYDYDPDLDYYFTPKRRFLGGGLLAAIVARLKAAGRDGRRTLRLGRDKYAANHSQKRA